MERMELVLRDGHRPAADLKDFSVAEAKKAHDFHAGFAQYSQTPRGRKTSSIWCCPCV